jgi:hypothetical protein
MKQRVHLLLPLIASALLWAADEPKVIPAGAEVELATSQPAGKPSCTAAIEGNQWPEEAADPVFAAALAPYGYPMICTHSGSAYVWRSMKLRPEQPKKSDKPVLTVAPILHQASAPKN